MCCLHELLQLWQTAALVAQHGDLVFQRESCLYDCLMLVVWHGKAVVQLVWQASPAASIHFCSLQGFSSTLQCSRKLFVGLCSQLCAPGSNVMPTKVVKQQHQRANGNMRQTRQSLQSMQNFSVARSARDELKDHLSHCRVWEWPAQ